MPPARSGKNFRHRGRSRITVVTLSVVSLWGLAAGYCQESGDPPIDHALAQEYFREAGALFASDGGKLWGVSLDGPIIFADVKSRIVVANRNDGENQLKQVGDIFAGRLSPGDMVANTAVSWSGTKWTMLMWPLPDDDQERRVLLALEAWHRVQDQLGFPSSGAGNEHLNSLQGRYLLQLEWRALAVALQETGSLQNQAISDALYFRARRRQLFEGAADEEREMEMHEGLAEYTGIRLALDNRRRISRTVANLNNRPGKLKTFVRSFAYLSGPAWGLLLEQDDESWIRQLDPAADLGQLLAENRKITLGDDLETFVAQRSVPYDGATLWADEQEKERQRMAVIQGHVEKFTQGPRLILPLANMNMSFNPNELIPIGEHGTVYPTLGITDDWGVLKVRQGALITADFQQVIVGVADDYEGARQTDEWTVELNDGWTVRRGADGTYRVARDD